MLSVHFVFDDIPWQLVVIGWDVGRFLEPNVPVIGNPTIIFKKGVRKFRWEQYTMNLDIVKNKSVIFS